MGKQLIIESLEIRTDTHTKVYSFQSGVNAVTGPIGSGKSSMLELIKYGLGGTARVMPAVRDNVRTIVVRVRAGSEHWEFTRALRSPIVQVFDVTTQESRGEWAATNRQNMRRIAPEIMDALDLPSNWRIPRSRRNPGEETVPISFWDVYRYLYLDQNRIDSSVIGHDDANLNNKRIAVFELAYGLASPRTVELQTETGRLKADAKRLRAAAASVERFLEDIGEPRPTDLPARRKVLESELADARVALSAAKGSARRGLLPRAALGAVANARARVEDLTAKRTALAVSLEESRSVVAQLDLDEQKLKREASAAVSLSGLEFVRCPRCLQSLSPERFEGDDCGLCGQHQEAEDDVKPNAAMLKVVREQRREAQDIMGGDEERLRELVAESEVAEANLYGEVARLDLGNSAEDSPLLSVIEDAAAQVAVCESALGRLAETEGRWANHAGLSETADELDERARELAAETAELKLELSQNTTRLIELSTLFNDILTTLRDPWFEEAHVDPETYLPMVDDEPFDMLAVGGGRKTIVNLSYHLANLYMSLSEGVEMLLPTLLIIDSPRKNVGEGALDRSVVSAIYSRLRTLQEASREKFQIIFADNDLPSEAAAWMKAHIQLNYDRPLVPGVLHRGEEESSMGGDETVELE